MTLLASPARFALWLLAAVLLAGCAANGALREGQALMRAGQYEAGLEIFSRLSAAEPGNARYRAEYLTQRDAAVETLLREGEAARQAAQWDAAETQIERARRLGAEGPRVEAALAALRRDRRHKRLLEDAQGALKKGARETAAEHVRTVLMENPRQRQAQNLQRRIEEDRHREGLSAPVLRSRLAKPVTLQFRDAPVRQVFDALSRSTGINFIFDREVRADLRTTVYVSDVAVEDAIDLILLPSQLEKKVLSETSVLIYPNTPAKLREYQELAIRTFYLANADAKQTLSMIKTMLKTKDIFIDEKLNLLVMRDTPEAIRLAEKLVAAQDLAEPEVVLEVAVLEISRSRLTELGVKWPETVSLSVVDPSGAPPLLLDELRNVGRGDIAVSPNPGVTLNARRTRGDSNLLANPRIRVRNREKARILVGDRLPVISAIVTPSTATPVTTETVTYLDVGLKLDVEPTVYLDDEVAIRVGLEVSTASNRRTTQNGTTVYDIGTRNANTTLRLRDGETQVLMGLIRDDDRRTASAVPGLGDLPVLGRAFANHVDDTLKSEIVLSITPRVVRNVQRAEVGVSEFWSGTETTLRAQPIMLRPVAPGEGVDAGGAGAKPAEPSAPRAPVTDLQLRWQGPQSLRAGETAELALFARIDQPLLSAALHVTYDASAFEVVGVTEGELLKTLARAPQLIYRADEAAGSLVISVSSAGAAMIGEGPLVKLQVRARATPAPASGRLTLAAVSPVGLAGRRLSVSAGAVHELSVAGPQ